MWKIGRPDLATELNELWCGLSKQFSSHAFNNVILCVFYLVFSQSPTPLLETPSNHSRGKNMYLLVSTPNTWYPENSLDWASGLWYSSNISGLFTFLNHFQGGRVKETKIFHVSIVRNSLTVRHSVRKSCDKWDTFDPPLRLGVGIETFSVSPKFHPMPLAYRPVQCRRNVLNCGCFDREKKSKSQKGGGGAILFLPVSRVLS